MVKKYKTVNKRAQIEITEKKSRFIATVMPVKSQEEVDDFLNELRKEHWNASHNCYAYQIGERDEIQRFSDDGEPQGTAGKPILEVLKGEELKDTVIVVTRYFGGTLLGTGGLVRAYGKSAKEGVLAAEIIQCILMRRYSVTIPYTLVGKIQYLLAESGYITEDEIYTDEVVLHVLVEEDECDNFEKKIIEHTSAEAAIQKKDTLYKNMPFKR
ncbi:MAG TPA: YigZ family protein [Epulopiscium sp.]|nr:YigZ family protein [Candidatus Epulonipiscium sp.]